MDKKTNKTDHVLNLLSGNKKKEKEKGKTPANIVKENNAKEKKAEEVASLIQEQLKLELEKEEMENAKNQKQKEEHSLEGVAKEVSTEMEDSLQEVVEKEEVKQIEGIEGDTPVEQLEEDKLEEEQQVDLAEIKQENTSNIEKILMPEVVEEKSENIEQVAQSQEEIPEYTFVNVMEHVVSKKAKVHMDKFGNCMCPRCIADVKAYALTHLPSKYVVIQPSGVFPLLNFYADKYSGQVLVELTKACIVVKENPHH